MSGPQTFHQKVTIPLVVILATVGGLFLIGTQLMNLSSNTAAEEPAVKVSASAEPINPVPAPSVDASVDPNLDVNGRLPVIVLNGTDTAGLAKSTSDDLHDADWVIEETGNWAGDPLLETTIFYPADGLSSAEELATQTGGSLVEATPDMSQTALTLVIIQ
jgi:LytR cell envelope-related transcriptional attenuator